MNGLSSYFRKGIFRPLVVEKMSWIVLSSKTLATLDNKRCWKHVVFCVIPFANS